MNISPGVGNNPSDQIVSGHGRVYGCNKAGGGAQFTATLQMSSATCSNLSMSGAAQFEWANGTHSTAFLSFDPQSGAKFTISGTITSGEFQGLIVQSQLRFTQVFNGSGASCSPSNLLQKIEFTNSRSLQLLTPNISHHDASGAAAHARRRTRGRRRPLSCSKGTRSRRSWSSSTTRSRAAS